MSLLEITIHEENPFYSLYAYGEHSRKIFVKDYGTILSYEENSVVYLFYTYPTHRTASVIRNSSPGGILLPGLSKKVRELFSLHASRVDKLHRALGFLNKRACAFSQNDGFYIRLFYILSRKGKINYASLKHLLENKETIQED